MSNTIKTNSGERLSFFKLFSEKKYRVSIPIIQRDYAQGRANTKEIRNNFLNALYGYLFENKPNRDLDFVYGTLSKRDKKTDFIPLDGQQRLTTLFLLHWYLYQISKNVEKKNEFKDALLKDGKSMFTYETRSSSSEFCDALMGNEIDFNKLLLPDINNKNESKENALSKTIKNCSWFFLSWQTDPTIQSMLTMLDAIHKRFVDSGGFFDRLTDIENPIITFMFLNLEDFKLTDDLYIKMNSRGISLTPFENFKAKFEQYLEKAICDRTFELVMGKTVENVSLKQYFSHNIDTKWANLFWNYRNLHNPSKREIIYSFDNELMNFVRVIFANQYAANVDIASKERDDNLEYLLGTAVVRNEEDYSDNISFSRYEELKAISEDAVLNLIDAFDRLVNGNEKSKVHVCDEYKLFYDENKIFENVLKHNFESNHERICFHAYIRFLIHNCGNLTGLEQWMRLVHNLSHPENSIIDGATGVALAIKSIEKLLPHSNSIMEYLKQNPNIAAFSTWQSFEEKVKAHLIIKSDKWKDKIEEAEKHRYFNGQIAFLLEFSGILDYYDLNNNCDWSDQEDTDYFSKFAKYVEKASIVFAESYDRRINDEDFIFERAVLSKGDYLTDASQFRKNLLSTNLVSNNIKRDHSWKRLLRYSGEANLKDKRMFVKQVFDDERFDVNDMKNSLESICQDRSNTWRDYLIATPALFEYCKQGFIRFENKDSILLYGESQSNHWHVEMYTFYLWKEYFKKNEDKFFCFKTIKYKDSRSIEECPYISFSEFKSDRKIYEVKIYYCIEDNLPNSYEIAFEKSKGRKRPENYGDTIKEILRKCDFEWNEEYEGYYFTSDEKNIIIEKMIDLHKEIELL